MCELLKSWLRANAACNSLPEEEVRCVGNVGLFRQHGLKMPEKTLRKTVITLRNLACSYDGKIATHIIIYRR
jgi:hypothetical protein